MDARMREILIRAGSVAIRARLLDTPTAQRIWSALPIYGKAQTWGSEVYFATAISAEREADAAVAGWRDPAGQPMQHLGVGARRRAPAQIGLCG